MTNRNKAAPTVYNAPVAGEARPVAILERADETIRRIEAALKATPDAVGVEAGLRTLAALGYTWHGGMQWMPPEAAPQASEAVRPALAVWYGSMPESNGKNNWTAILHRKGDGLMDGPHITIDRSEYPDRVRYEADRLRFLIGEIDKEPWILDYDADKCDAPTENSAAQAIREWLERSQVPGKPYLYCLKPSEIDATLSKLRAEGVQAGDDWPARWEKMRHEANEWADMAINGLQWVRNIQDGTSTADAALANLNTNLAHCRATQALASAPVEAQPVAWEDHTALQLEDLTRQVERDIHRFGTNVHIGVPAGVLRSMLHTLHAPVAGDARKMLADVEALDGVAEWLKQHDLTVNVGAAIEPAQDVQIESSAGWLLRLLTALNSSPHAIQAATAAAHASALQSQRKEA